MPRFLFRNVDTGALVSVTGTPPYDAGTALPEGSWQVAVTSDWAAGTLDIAAAPVDLFLIAGQSNAVDVAPWDSGADWPAGVQQLEQWAVLADQASEPGSGWIATASAGLIAAARPLHHRFKITLTQFGWPLQFALDWLAANPTHQLVLVPAGCGGTGFQDDRWNPGDDLFQAAVDRANRAMALLPGATFRGILWHQGENDAQAGGAAAAAHAGKLDAMIAGMRADITAAGPTTPFVAGGMVPGWVSGNADRETVQAGIEATPNRVAYTALAAATGLSGQVGTDVHFNAAAMRTLGGRYVTAFAEAEANAPAVPGQVTDLAAIAGDEEIGLTWSAPAANLSPITDYAIEVDGTVISDGTSATPAATIAGLVNDQEYDFRVAAINAVGQGPWSDVVSETPEAAVPDDAEAGAEAHWLFGTDNATNADLIAGTVMSAVGTAPVKSAGYLTISGRHNGLDSGVAEAADITFCAAIRLPSGSGSGVQTVLGGTLVGGTAGWSPLRSSGNALNVNNFGATGLVTADAAVPQAQWILVAVSLAASGDYVYFRGGSASDIVVSGSGSRGTVRAVNVGLGDVHFDNASWAGSFDCAECIIFHGTKTQTQLHDILLRSRDRLAARGIALVAP